MIKHEYSSQRKPQAASGRGNEAISPRADIIPNVRSAELCLYSLYKSQRPCELHYLTVWRAASFKTLHEWGKRKILEYRVTKISVTSKLSLISQNIVDDEIDDINYYTCCCFTNSVSGGDRERFALSNVPRRVETWKKPALSVWPADYGAWRQQRPRRLRCVDIFQPFSESDGSFRDFSSKH